MNSPNGSHKEGKNHKEDNNKTKKHTHLNQQHLLNFYANLDYSCLSDFVLLRLMGVEMPPVHRNSYQQLSRGPGYWRHQYLNGLMLPLLPNVLPFYHSPNMIPNAQKKVYYWNRKENHRDEKVRDPMQEFSKNLGDGSGSGGGCGGYSSSPVPRKRHLIGMMENSVLDNSSEDSFQSATSDNGKNMCFRRIYGPMNNKGNRNNNSVYYYHNNHRPEHLPYRRHCNGQNYGERRYSGRHSPVEYATQNNHRNREYHFEDQCLISKSQSDVTSNHENNCHSERLYITGRHNSHNSQPISPDRFLSRSHLVEATRCPAALKTDGEWGKLSRHIYTKFLSNQQTQEVFRDKMILWKKLFTFIRANFPGFGLYLVGSTMSGFGSNDSDVDMCLLVRHTEMEQRKEAISYLGQISKILKNCGFVKRVELIQAKVPILKFESLGLEVDLNCNNAVGIRNTHLLYCYSQLDWRVRPLVLIVKLWAARHDINDAKKSTISSYSLSLMVIHYLQCGVSPPVLPCLQEMYKDKFSPHSDISKIDLHEELYPYFSKNRQSLGELLVGFLQYYGEFNYSKYAISIRLAARLEIEDCRLVRNSKNDPHQWKYLCIEEPFDLTNTARSVYDYAAFRRIHRVFCKSYEKLKETRSLDSIFKQRIY